MQEIQITIYAESDATVYLDEWNDGGVWLKINISGGGAYTPLTRKEAEQMLQGLQEILNKEVKV